MAKKRITAEEFAKQLENDVDYVTMKEQKEQERLKAIVALESESASFVQECSRFGYSIKTSGGLSTEKNLDPNLVSIIIKYLYEPHYSNGFRSGLAHSLTVPEAAQYFITLLDLYKKEQDPDIRFSIGVAVSTAAREQNDLNIIEQLIFDKKGGVARNALLSTIKRMKGEQRERTLAFAREDPELKINLHVFGLRRHKVVQERQVAHE